MARLSWGEIKQRSVAFAREWVEETREEAEGKSFWDEFFNVFGVRRRTVASFEEPVRSLKGTYGFIDLFWRGMLLVEHKSAGKSLAKGHSQAIQYIQDLVRDNRHEEIPRYVIVSDFARIAIHDLDQAPGSIGASFEFPLSDLHRHVERFAFIPGYQQHSFDEEDPVNIKAVERMGALHDALEDAGYTTGHSLERMLVRVLFCFFADDTGIFESQTFSTLLEGTREDGTDVGPLLEKIFQVLDTPEDSRQLHLDEMLASLPYVNGRLFGEHLQMADFNAQMRKVLLVCSRFDWSQISPAVFGALFQSVMQPRERRQIGAHYTSERDILKVIRTLFLDELLDEFERAKRSKTKLREFHEHLAELKFLDPACGCGNFLVVTYRELRKIEIELLPLLHGADRNLDIHLSTLIDVDQMYGIEIEEWPVRIAEVALWLVDHQMNLRLSEILGQYFRRLPLQKSPHILHANALRTQWEDLLAPEECSYILGNPPFVGSKFLTASQKEDIGYVRRDAKNSGVLDYVTAWYFKASEYIRNTKIRVGFVSTNSISQGEQVGLLWGELFQRGMKIHFAHRTFAWESEARGKAHVHVVIIGFGAFETGGKCIYDYEGTDGDAANPTKVRNVNPYLVEASDLVITNRSHPLCSAPEMRIGNKPIDDGNYLFTTEEMEEFIKKEPASQPLFRPWLGSFEFINGVTRHCLWLGECTPSQLRSMPLVLDRIKAVKKYRLASKSAPTQKLADTPTRFHVENFPTAPFLVIPKVSSERRRYIPMTFMPESTLISDLCMIVRDATLYHFGVLTSAMHMAWVRQVCGRLKSDYRYSIGIVYNNFPWPKATDGNRRKVEEWARKLLNVRKRFQQATLADLYDPLTMPPDLVKAHHALDRAVDRSYRAQLFETERQRVEFLFDLYEDLLTPLTTPTSKKKRRR